MSQARFFFTRYGSFRYFDKTQSMVELRFNEIIFHYLRGTFFVDLLGSLPTDLFFIDKWSTHIVAREASSLIFGFRIFSLLKYLENLGLDYSVRRAVLNLSSTMLWIAMVLYWQACIHWIFPVACASLLIPQKPSNDSWINAVGLWEESDAIRFYHCNLRSISSFFRGGFLVRTEPKTPEDQFLVSNFTEFR